MPGLSKDCEDPQWQQSEQTNMRHGHIGEPEQKLNSSASIDSHIRVIPTVLADEYQGNRKPMTFHEILKKGKIDPAY